MSINTGKYKNIIFDLGGVLFNIDYSLTAKAFTDLGITNFDELYSQAQQSNLFDLFEKGKISAAGFRNEIRNVSGKNLNDANIDAAWNAMLLGFPAERLKLLDKLKTTHRTFLLSNTNAIHIAEVNATLKKTLGINDLSGHFEKVYLSHQLGMRKPDAEIFEFVLSENKLDPAQTLFIDDSIQHTQGAKTVGIDTHWLQKSETILDLF